MRSLAVPEPVPQRLRNAARNWFVPLVIQDGSPDVAAVRVENRILRERVVLFHHPTTEDGQAVIARVVIEQFRPMQRIVGPFAGKASDSRESNYKATKRPR
jgi:hypothetical protein